jgi:cbb3-type cytochrome oxidase subunit 1
MCDITNQFNRPYPFINENNIILIYNDNIIENPIQIFNQFKKYFLKIVRNIISICEGLYESLEYSEAKTITGLIIILYFITLVTIHLLCSLIKKNNKIRVLEKQLQYMINN